MSSRTIRESMVKDFNGWMNGIYHTLEEIRDHAADKNYSRDDLTRELEDLMEDLKE